MDEDDDGDEVEDGMGIINEGNDVDGDEEIDEDNNKNVD